MNWPSPGVRTVLWPASISGSRLRAPGSPDPAARRPPCEALPSGAYVYRRSTGDSLRREEMGEVREVLIRERGVVSGEKGSSREPRDYPLAAQGREYLRRAFMRDLRGSAARSSGPAPG